MHRTLRETAKVDKPKPDAGEPQPAPADSGGREAADAKPFLDQIMKKAKPGLKALIGNAYRVSRQGGRVMFYLDKRHANLIPMIKSPQNYKILEDLSAEHFGRPFDIHFMIGNDPSIAQAQKRDQDALEIVKSNPVVKFVLENFNGTIVNNTILDEKKE
ncbi:MAG: hypothetical protein QNK37_07950 [Acidobacteriota bacterium]|nr:hypothetical protein [Acidobacteriota bacterium]